MEAGELRDLALEENRALIERTAALEEELAALMVPQDPTIPRTFSLKSAPVPEATRPRSFPATSREVYALCRSAGMKVELVSESFSDAGGYKEIVFTVNGNQPYRILKHESGVHHVQRVPAREAQGQIRAEHRNGRRLSQGQERRGSGDQDIVSAGRRV